MENKKAEGEPLRHKIIVAVITAILSVIGAIVVWKITKSTPTENPTASTPIAVTQTSGIGNIGNISASDGGNVNVTINNNSGGNAVNTSPSNKKAGIFLVNEDYYDLSFLGPLLQRSKENALFEVKIGYDANDFTGNEKEGFFYEGESLIVQIDDNKYNTKIPIYSYKKSEYYSGRSKKILLEKIRSSINDAIKNVENQRIIFSIIQKECKK